jgi:hypothetical protein
MGERTPKRKMAILLSIMGGLCLGLLLFRLGTIRWGGHSDFDQLYLSGIVWREGRPPYGAVDPVFVVPNGPNNSILGYFLYSPLGAMLAAPLTFLAFPSACLLWLWFSFGLFLSGITRILRLLLPHAHLSLHLFLVGLVAISSALRWNMYLLQPTVFVCGALFWFACCYAEKRTGWALAFALLASIKFSYLLPVVGLPLFRRDVRFLAIFALFLCIGNSLSMMQTGFGETLNAYRTTLARHDHYGSSFHPSANVYYQWRTNTLPATLPDGSPMEVPGDQVHFTYIFSAWTHDVAASKRLHGVAALAVLGILAVQWRRMRDPARWETPPLTLMLFSYLMAVSLIIIYHQRYDLIALFPLGIFALAVLLRQPRNPAALTIVLGLAIFACFAPATLLTNIPVILVQRTGILAFIAITGYFSIIMALCAGWLLTREWKQAVGNAPLPNTPFYAVIEAQTQSDGSVKAN